MLEVLALLLDTLIAALLGATIFYAMRLYTSLSSFREHRDDFEHVVAKLVSSITQAEQAMKNLKHAGTQEAQNLEELIHHAKDMTEELRMVNEASGNMAKRLEDLAEKNRKIVEGFDPRTPYRAQRETGSQDKQANDSPPPPLAASPKRTNGTPSLASEQHAQKSETAQARAEPREQDSGFPSFFIHDKDFNEDTSAASGSRNGFVDVFDDEEEGDEQSPMPQALQSQAERELFQALQKNKRKAAANGGRG